ncbi:glutamate racemase [Mammaliicoccus stepanovicii]|uniref:Glutamate racemase n=1 Tax=Mammaliicoccus stepanovicii TaxID=643214 RepID=A0A239YF02_9STAP|nr:aspartate/glutamate racemase family protein [Mammaliicoccus stepanovicii]PNZ75550.1 hypothetical protein CD111_07680 [Mammaliicoccus stepanovicii]GGI42645.1 glutamate racemase [Mammaliicoccus stepanovicii]SNV56808.1 glutamate racemase [Mammaliicoccus stepanovicii]
MNSKLKLNRPIAVFDAGIGSYAIVELLKKEFPKQDIIYLADRNSFPYGNKTNDELAVILRNTLKYLETWLPSLIVVASNAPSVTILPDIQTEFETDIIGVYPPIKEAIEKSSTKEIGVLGVKSMIETDEVMHYINEEKSPDANINTFNASSLVELVETGAFMNDKYRTLITIKSFMDNVLDEHEAIDVFTLSSTHLPWLYSYFKELYPHIMFIDPSTEVVEQVGKYAVEGSGMIKSLVTTNQVYTLESFNEMLNKLNIELELEEVHI